MTAVTTLDRFVLFAGSKGSGPPILFIHGDEDEAVLEPGLWLSRARRSLSSAMGIGGARP